ncbi:MAG: FHA domain-containing protein [Solirubrobacterales bacterium]|nr:FHA domain-containing protein [Solirubrobacterales bacterium]
MRPAMARLEVVAGRALGMSILLDDELLIGRHAEGAGRLADDEEISRSHARISLDRSGFCAIEDLGSTNGTFVNGLRVASPQTLSVGDTIELGGTTLVVRDLPVPGPPKRNAGSAERPAAHDVTPAQRHTPGPEAEAGETGARAAASEPLTVTLHVDFAAREATLALDGHSDPIRLMFDGTSWRAGP